MTKKIQVQNQILIIENGPHFRYIADIWELDKKVSFQIEMKYILEIIDHFSKWLWSYPLESKEADNILKNIKNYILDFRKPKIFQTDNGKEFVNQKVKLYFENNNIDFIQSSPNHSQTNGVIEVAHKNLQKAINKVFLIKKEKFDLEQCIIETLEHYNYQKIHSSSGYTPFDLKDT